VVAALRSAGIASEIYPDITRIKKQLDYANKKQIPFALVIGSEEMNSGLLALKDLETGEQEKFYLDDILTRLRN
jgi:histidyl-tRNA synthetase